MPPTSTVRTVAEVMSSPAITALSSETVAVASQRMAEQKKGSVVIVDGERPIGILTERDLVRFNATGAAAADTKVSEWMTQPVDCAAPDLSVQEAFHEFAENGYRHLPVVDGEKLVGVVSLRALMGVAQIQPVVHPSALEAPPGLEGVIVAETEVGDVRGLEGFYHYRQYNAVDLADKLPLEDVWHLLIDGHLPSPAERQAFADEVKPLRVIPASVADLLPAIAASSQSVMEGVRSAMSMVGAAEGYQPTLDIDAAERRRNALQMCAVMPSLIMGIYRLQQGLAVIEPRMDLGYGANYLWMLTGDDFDPDRGRAVEQYQITTIDHGFNASTFTARVITSSGADVAAAVVGAMGALSGPLHGGAPSRALALLEAIGTPENARPYLIDHVTRGEKIMGFGHRVYKTDDPRSTFLRSVAERIGADKIGFAKVV
ncbi:MAG: citrate/2-methylcitrate synthase, partial [Acidimicrobiales bacterium]|nr:citrate/2-methylcitrate synthase [Acidimicrobiales bacterium]